jgi:adenylosuccinate synthase
MSETTAPLYVVVLSGAVAAGKTTLARALCGHLGAKLLTTREAILRRLPRTPRTRADLQTAGEQFDEQTHGKWVGDEVAELAKQAARTVPIVVDAVRILAQIDAVKSATSRRVFHIHLTAPYEVLKTRYASKAYGIGELDEYAQVAANPTESQIDRLAEAADIVIDTSATAPDEAVSLFSEFVDRATR